MRALLILVFALMIAPRAGAVENTYVKLDQQILALIMSQNFDKLEATLSEIEDSYAQDYRNEQLVDIAFDAFYRANTDLNSQLGNWIKAKPNSYLAYTARGAYYTSLGWAKRKGRFIDQTTQKQIDGMSYYFQQAFSDLEHARSINKNALHPLCYEMEILMNYGRKEQVRGLYEEALKLNPMTLTARWQYMTTILPRWGGSINEMEKVIELARPYYNNNPALKVLDGRVAAERGDQASFKNDCAQAESFYTEALKSGEHWYYFKQRGQIYSCNQRYELSMRDLNIAISLRPNILNTAYRVPSLIGDNLYGMQRYKDAIPFYSNQIVIDPSDHKSYDLRGDCYLRLGKLDKALSDFKTAIRLSPGNTEYLGDIERVKQMEATAN